MIESEESDVWSVVLPALREEGEIVVEDIARRAGTTVHQVRRRLFTMRSLGWVEGPGDGETWTPGPRAKDVLKPTANDAE